LFCVYHDDKYPASVSNGSDYSSLGPDPKLLRGRDIGSDFSAKNGWSMYHGEVVPGFPAHAHYGFETISATIFDGVIYHHDSHGNAARYGGGDVQWLTTGAGIEHSEMFPLLNDDKPNHIGLFQIWLNLPKAKKRAKPFFSMAWNEDVPEKAFGEPGKQAVVRMIGGSFMGMTSVPPPPDSYASDPRSELVVATFKLQPEAKITLPAASASDINRALYFYLGSGISVDSTEVKEKVSMIKLRADREVEITALGSDLCEMLLLQGRPLNEPVVQQGPFVTNSREELVDVYNRYRRTQFGTWKWGRRDPVFARSETRFLSREGKREVPPSVRQATEKAKEEKKKAEQSKQTISSEVESNEQKCQ